MPGGNPQVSRPRFVLTPQARADLVDIWNCMPKTAWRAQTGFWNGCLTSLRAWPRRPAWVIIGKTWRMRGTAARAMSFLGVDNGDEIVYRHSVLCQTSMPYRDPGGASGYGYAGTGASGWSCLAAVCSTRISTRLSMRPSVRSKAPSCPLLAGFSRLTQLGLLRLLTTASAMGGLRLTNEEAWGVYDGFMADDRVRIFPELSALDDVFRSFSGLHQASAKVWVDACLAAHAPTGPPS